MSDVEKPTSLNSHVSEALPNALARSLIKQCREHSEHYVQTLFEPLAKQLDDDLFKLVDKTQESEKAQLYSDAMLKLSSEREGLAQQFTLSYSQRLSQALNPGGLAIDTEDGMGGLTLIDDAQLEESLMINQITAKVFEAYSDELYALELRLSLMLPDLNMDEGQVPFGSGPICNAFEMLLSPLGFDIKVKLAIYRSLERTLLASIGTLFDELNNILREAGVLPEIKRKAKKNESVERVTKLLVETTASEGGGAGGESAGSVTDGVAHGYNGVQQLAGLFADGLSGAPEKQQALLAAPVTPQLVEVLSGLQMSNDLLEVNTEFSGEELKARIKTQLSEREGAPAAGIRQLDDETIDVISMIFDEEMADDDAPRINDRYTILVAGLADGAWIELEDDGKVVRRVKLAWKGDEFTKYAFVNWRYKVVAEKSYYALADEFRQGSAVMVEKLPLFDRAFDRVFSKIMQLAG